MLCEVFDLRLSAGFSRRYVQYLVCGMCGISSVLCAVFSLWYVRDFVGVMYSNLSVLCAGFGQCHVPYFVCVLCGLQFVLFAVFSLCYVRDSVCVCVCVCHVRD